MINIHILIIVIISIFSVLYILFYRDKHTTFSGGVLFNTSLKSCGIVSLVNMYEALLEPRFDNKYDVQLHNPTSLPNNRELDSRELIIEFNNKYRKKFIDDDFEISPSGELYINDIHKFKQSIKSDICGFIIHSKNHYTCIIVLNKQIVIHINDGLQGDGSMQTDKFYPEINDNSSYINTHYISGNVYKSIEDAYAQLSRNSRIIIIIGVQFDAKYINHINYEDQSKTLFEQIINGIQNICNKKYPDATCINDSFNMFINYYNDVFKVTMNEMMIIMIMVRQLYKLICQRIKSKTDRTLTMTSLINDCAKRCDYNVDVNTSKNIWEQMLIISFSVNYNSLISDLAITTRINKVIERRNRNKK